MFLFVWSEATEDKVGVAELFADRVVGGAEAEAGEIFGREVFYARF